MAASWTQDHHDAQRTSYHPVTPALPWALAWAWNGPDSPPSTPTSSHIFNAPREGRPVTGGGWFMQPAGASGVYGISIANGPSTQWHWTSHTNVDASPAYDPTTMMLLVGSTDGFLSKVDVSSGTTNGTPYNAGSPIRKAVMIVGAYAYVVTDAGVLHKVSIATMTAAWTYTATGGVIAQTPPAYSAGADKIIFCTSDLFVHAVANTTGALSWRVKPNTALSPSTTDAAGLHPFTFTLGWPVVADGHGVVFVRVRPFDDQGTAYGSALQRTGQLTPGTQTEIKNWLQTNQSSRSVYALNLTDGTEAFTPNLPWNSTEDWSYTMGTDLVAITAASWSAGVVTLTLATPMATTMPIGGPFSVSGATPNGYNTVPGTSFNVQSGSGGTTLRFNLPTNPGAYVGGGYALGYAYNLINQMPAVRGFADGTEVAYGSFRTYIDCENSTLANKGSDDGRWQGHMGEMVLDSTTVPGLNPGDLRYVRHARYSGNGNSGPYLGNAYSHIQDEAGPVSLLGDQVWHLHSNALEPVVVTDRSSSLGFAYTSPINTTDLPLVLAGTSDSVLGDANSATHFWSASNVFNSDARIYSGKSNGVATGAWWSYWNTYSPSIIAGVGDALVRPRSVIVDNQTVLISDNSGGVLAYTHSGSVAASSTISSLTPVSGSVAQYGTYELDFNVGTPAAKLQVPYDTAPPAGITAGQGVTVDGLFLPPGASNWATQAIVQPAYFAQPYALQVLSGRQQAVPTTGPVWKVKFTPKQQGAWQARVRVIDSNGTTESGPLAFTVTAPVGHGPIRVSPTDTRLFEYADGTVFTGNGINGDNTTTIDPKFPNNGINLLRIWFNNYSLLGSGHGDVSITPWTPLNITDFDHYVTPAPASPPAQFGFHLPGASATACLFTFQQTNATNQAFLSCKRNTTYKFSMTVRTSGLTGGGAKVTLKQSGFQTAGGVTAALAGLTPILTTVPGSPPTGWTTFTGNYTTGASEDFFGSGAYLYLALEGSTTGFADITNLWCQEVLGSGQLGINQFDTGTGALDAYSQLGSAMLDNLVASAESAGVAIKAVFEDKNETSWKYLNTDGTINATPNDNNFYCPVNTTQGGWLQRAFARYLTARWGYSVAIHSWEHVNEGDGSNAQASFTDAIAAYFHSIDPNRHLVSTSTYASERTSFWALMPNVDYQDFHAYLDTGDLLKQDYILPIGSWTWIADGTYPGAIRMDTSTVQSWSLPCEIQEAGTWTISMQVNSQSTTGGSFGFSSDRTAPVTVPAGTNWTTISATFSMGSANPAALNVILGAGTHTGGTGAIRNFAITSPSGKRLFTYIGDGTFPQQTDTSHDAAAFHTAYDGYATRRGQGLYTVPIVRGEWNVASTSGGAGYDSSGYVTGLTSDIKMVWLHTSLFARLAPGCLYPLWWNMSSPSIIDTNNGWGRFLQLTNFLSGIPLSNGKYQDIVATPSVGSMVVVGQKDLTNSKAHFWAHDTSMKWSNSPGVAGAGAISAPSGTLTIRGLSDGSYNADLWLFDVNSTLTSAQSGITSTGGIMVMDLGAIASAHGGLTDLAVKLTPVSVVAPPPPPPPPPPPGGPPTLATINYRIIIRDSTGALKTGLTPAFANAHVRTDIAGAVTAPAITELNAADVPGVYLTPFDPVANGDCTGVVNTGLTAPFDQIPVSLTRESSLIIGNIDAAVSTRATPGQILVTPANLLATDGTGRVTIGSLGTAAITASTFAAGALDAVWSTSVRNLTSLAAPGNAADLAAGVWNAVASSYNTVLTLGNKVNASGTAADPWSTAVPGAYPAGTAGNLLGNTPTPQAIADTVMDNETVETGMTFRQMLRLTGAVLLGRASNGPLGTVFRAAVSDSKPRVTTADDASGNRATITYDSTP